jgi:predicted DNA-binding transcriptional regulator AlpA
VDLLKVVNYALAVRIDPAELLDSHDVAELLGLSSHRAVSTYRGRYDDFPAPVVEKGSGRCQLWLRAEVEVWARATGRLPRDAGGRDA